MMLLGVNTVHILCSDIKLGTWSMTRMMSLHSDLDRFGKVPLIKHWRNLINNASKQRILMRHIH